MTDIACKQSGCTVALNGKCLEGFGKDKCPFLTSVVPEDVDSDAKVFASADLFELPSGEALTEEEASDLMKEVPALMVVVAGPVDSGKTTILTSLYETFLIGPVLDVVFKGSETLFGFERRCHLGREESGREDAATQHTSHGEPPAFLHLNLLVNPKAASKDCNLLLSDISGETFRRLRDFDEEVLAFSSLKRADRFCIVIDGDKVAVPEGRQVVRNDARALLRSIIQADVLKRECKIDLIFSKWDAIESLEASEKDEAQKFIAALKDAIVLTVASKHQVHCFEVAARPVSKALPYAHGIPTLLGAWLNVPEASYSSEIIVPDDLPGQREVERYARVAYANRLLGGQR